MVVVWPNHRGDPRSDLPLHPQERHGDGDLDGHPTNGLHAVGGGVDHRRNPQCKRSQLDSIARSGGFNRVDPNLGHRRLAPEQPLGQTHPRGDVCHHCHDWARPRHDAKELGVPQLERSAEEHGHVHRHLGRGQRALFDHGGSVVDARRVHWDDAPRSDRSFVPYGGDGRQPGARARCGVCGGVVGLGVQLCRFCPDRLDHLDLRGRSRHPQHEP